MAATASAPILTDATAAATRVRGIDLARAIAILGMIVVNFTVVMTGPSHEDGGAFGWWYAQCTGRASAGFVVLAGIGISLLTRRDRQNGDLRPARTRLLKRAIFLFALGLAFQLVWPGDILHYYGVYLALAAPFLGARTRTLWLAALSSVALFCAAFATLNYSLGWNWWTLTYHDFWSARGFARNLLFNGFHPVLPWIAFLFAGMALGRTDLTMRRTRLQWIAAGAAVFAGAMIASHLILDATYELPQAQRLWWRTWAGTGSLPPMPLYVLQAGGLAVSIIGLCVELGFVLPGWSLWPLIATGQLALTIYVLHVLLGLGVIEEVWGDFESTRYSLEFAMTASLTFFGIALLAATVLRALLPRGPLEWVMRRISR